MYEEFKIHLPVLRAYKDEKTGDMMFEGIASSTSVDSHETVFNAECQESFMQDILDGISRGEPVELESEHNGDDEPFNILGPVISAEIIDNNKLRIVGRLDPDNSKAVYYFKKMTVEDPVTKRTKQFGLSINGAVVKAHYEFNNELNKSIRVFDRVILKRVGIVRKPSNPDSWIEKLLRSVEWENVEIKERSNKEMEKDTVKVDAVIEETETRTEDGATETDDTAVATETVSEVEAEAPAEEVAATEEVEAAADTDEEVRTEEAVTEEVTEEKVDRASYWVSGRLLGSMQAVISAVCELEDLAEYDSESVNVGMTEEALAAAKECFAKMQLILGQHIQDNTDRAVDTGNMATSQKEDLDDEVIKVTASAEDNQESNEEVRSEDAITEADDSAKEKPVVEVEVRAEFNKQELMVEVADVMGKYLDGEFTEKLDRKFNELLAEKLGEANKVNEELVRKLEDMDKTNSELVARLEKVENSPASRPAAQLFEMINRSDDFASKKAANEQKAREENDTQELFRHKLFPSTYVGYGEFQK